MTKEALTLALESLESKYIVGCSSWRFQQDEAITAIKEALAQDVPETNFGDMAQPEKTVCPFCSSEWVTAEQHDTKMVSPPEQQEPVACVVPHGATMRLEWASVDAAHNAKIGPLYTTPPQRKPLTDEEIGAILEGVNAYGTRLYTFARAIEAAHSIKGDA